MTGKPVFKKIVMEVTRVAGMSFDLLLLITDKIGSPGRYSLYSDDRADDRRIF